jgi:DNA-binding response OmpR family regulator
MSRLKPLVLIIDDDPEFRAALQLVLSRFGLNTQGVGEAAEFLSKAASLKPDLYLIDMQLGNKTGLELITELRTKMKVIEPILVLSGAREASVIAQALELGANDFITKPLDRSFLASKLLLYVDSKTMEEHRASAQSRPLGGIPAQIDFKGNIIEVDELGVKLRSSCLLPKGTVLKLKCDVLQQAGVPGGEALVAVVSSEVDPVSRLYTSYLEFDGVDVEFMQRIRSWIALPASSP